MKKRLQALRNEEGLTLVELLAVIVILAIIAVVAFVMIGQVIENSRKDSHIANAQQMIASTKLWEAAGEKTTPGDETIDFDTLNNSGYIDDIFDSWDKTPIVDGEVKIEVATDTDPAKYTVTLVSPGCTDLTDADETALTEENARENLCP